MGSIVTLAQGMIQSFSIDKVSVHTLTCFSFFFCNLLHLVQTWRVSSESLLAESLTHDGFFGVLG